jgi:hypothetical protein
MMRFCPKCGDYYADPSLAFCLGDGTPLADVSPLGESWSEARRVVEEKENVLRERKRRLKWRRIVSAAVAMLIATMVLLVVAVNGFIYLKPKPDEVVAVSPPTQEVSEPAEPAGAILPQTPADSTPTPGMTTPTPTPKASPTPTRTNANSNTRPNTNGNHNNTNGNTNHNANTNTNVNANANTHTNVNTNTNVNVHTDVNANSDTRPTLCSDADRRRESETLVKSFGALWRQRIERDRREIMAQAGQAGAAAVLSPLEYESKFLKGCSAALVTVRYAWRVDSPTGLVTVQKKKVFPCVKLGGAWLCR